MDLNEAYFNTFDLERIGIDKVFFLVYDAKYATVDHDFDFNMRDKFIRNVKRSQIKNSRFEQVIRKEAQYSSWELQLKGPRVMRFHINIMHYLQEQFDIRPNNVIYDSNYLPVSATEVTLVDHIKALRTFVDHAVQLYKELLMKHWDYEAGYVKVKFSKVEFPFEVYPASVDDIAGRLLAKGVSFSRYNTQSGTLYLTKGEFDNKVNVNQKYDKVEVIDDEDLEVDPPLKSMSRNIVYFNKVNSGINLNKIQVKIYQKTFGLCRIEFSTFSDDNKMLLNFDIDDAGNCIRSDNDMTADVIDFVHFNLKRFDLDVERYDRTLDDVVQFLSVAFKESEDILYNLRSLETFEACESNRVLRQRLVRKGILLKKFDSNGTFQRGVYLVSPIVRDLLNLYKPSGFEHFISNSLYPDL